MASLQSVFNDSVNELCEQFSKLLTEKNSISTSSADPPKKKLTSYTVHHMVFAVAFANKFNAREIISKPLPSMYHIRSLSRVEELFGVKTIVRINKFNDFSLLTPVMVVTKCDDKHSKGDLVIPLKENGEKMSCLVPIGPDEEDKKSLTVSIKSLVKDFSPLMLPERRVEGNPLTIKKGNDYESILATDIIEEGDFLIIMGQPYEIIAKTDDDCFTSTPNTRNVIRTKKPFINKIHYVTRQHFRYKKVPVIHGYITEIEISRLSLHHPVEIKYSDNKLQFRA